MYRSDERGLSLSKEQWSVFILLLFHLVGVIGLASPFHDLFALLSPMNLLLTLGILVVNHQGTTKKLLLVGSAVALIGYLAEVIGVHTGAIFGTYHYGKNLGFKVAEVPLIIGVNWFILVYASAYCAQHLTKNWKKFQWLKYPIGAGIMVSLDFLIEPIAIQLDFWQWQDNHIPVQNFIGWFLIALALQPLMHTATPNSRLSPWVLGAQALFFASLQLVL